MLTETSIASADPRHVRRTADDDRSLATYVPPRVLTNADLEKMVDTTDEWILQRTGIRERHIVDPGVATSDLGEGGGARGDRAAPGLHARRHRLHRRRHRHAGHDVSRAPRAWCSTRSARTTRGASICGAACSAFTYSLTTASQMVATGAHEHALVVGADVMSSIIDYTDRSTCVLFGDGAGAVVVSAARTTVGRHPRLRARDRRQRRSGAVHAGRRQPCARRRTRPSTSGCTT